MSDPATAVASVVGHPEQCGCGLAGPENALAAVHAPLGDRCFA